MRNERSNNIFFLLFIHFVYRSEVSSISGAYGSAEGERVPPSRLASARGARPSSDAIRSMSGRQDASRETPSYEGAVVPGVKPLGSINVRKRAIREIDIEALTACDFSETRPWRVR